MRDLVSIIESLDSSPDLQWSDFSDEDQNLIRAEFQIDDGHFIVNFSNYRHNGGYWTINFVRNGTFELTGTGNQFRVMAGVNEAVYEFLREKRPTSVGFEIDKTEKSRGPLYMRLANMAMKRFPEYSLARTKTIQGMNGTPPHDVLTFEREPDKYVAPEKTQEEIAYDAEIAKEIERQSMLSSEERDAEWAELEKLFDL